MNKEIQKIKEAVLKEANQGTISVDNQFMILDCLKVIKTNMLVQQKVVEPIELINELNRKRNNLKNEFDYQLQDLQEWLDNQEDQMRSTDYYKLISNQFYDLKRWQRKLDEIL
nr:hypothetical protein [uncultured Draconibacterium sp.]